MTVERIKDLITQYDELIRYRKLLLDFTFAEEFLSIIPTCMENQETLEAHLREKTNECQRLRISLKTARDEIAKLYTKCQENNHVKEFLDYAIFLSTFRNFTEKSYAASDLVEKNSLQCHNPSLSQYFPENLSLSCVKQEWSDGRPQFNEFTTYRCNSLNSFSILSNEDIATMNSKMEKVYEMFDAEISRRKQIEKERNDLELLSKKLCCLLLKYQKRSCFLDEKKDSDPLILGDNLTTADDKSNEIYATIEYDLFSDDVSLILPPMDFRDAISEKTIDSNELFGKIEQELAKCDEISNPTVWHEIQNHTEISALPFPVIQQPQEYLQSDISDFNIDHNPYSNQGFQNYSLLGYDYESTAMECGKTDDVLFADLNCAENVSSKFSEPSEEKFSNQIIGKSILPINELASSTPIPPQTRFDCDVCGKSFAKKIGMTLHRRRAHTKKNPSYHCENCGKSYSAKNGEEKLTKCPVCDTYKHNDSLEVSKTPGDFCDKNNLTKNNLVNHPSHVHKGKKLHECTICGKQFVYEGRLRTHVLEHKSQESSKPSICNESFKFSNDETKPVLRKKEARFQCAHCDKRYVLKTSIIYHLFSRHFSFSELQESFKCTICDKTFVLKTHLKIHQVVHNSDKPMKCSICGKGFRRADHKTGHEWRVHGIGDTFNCTYWYCKNKYRTKESLMRHLQNDHGNLACIDKL